MISWDVIVVGGGVIGSSIAYHAARRGAKVLLCDDPGTPSFPSASWASAGGLRQQNRDAREWPLTTMANRRWPMLEDELQSDLGFRSGGHLHVVEQDADLVVLDEQVGRERAAGIDVRVVRGAELHEVAPALGPQIVAGAYTPTDGQADPRAVTQAFTEAAGRSGAEIRPHRVSEILVRQGSVEGVRCGSETIRSRWVVLAAGSWSGNLASSVGIELPIRLRASQMLLSDPTDRVLEPTITAKDQLLSLKQTPSGQFLIGGGWPAVVNTADHSCQLIPESITGSWAVAATILPSISRRNLASKWCGLEAESFDGVPLIGPVESPQRLFLATAFSNHGFQLSPAVGVTVAQALAGQEVQELAAFSPRRIAAFDPTSVADFRSRSGSRTRLGPSVIEGPG